MGNTLAPWLDYRASGVLLHPTSLPSDLGIGNFGRESRRVLEVLSIAAAPMSEPELAEVLSLKAEVLSAALESLSAAALIHAEEGPERRFRPRRAYERWAVAESLTPVRRTALHERMAAMLERAGVDDEQGFLRLSVHREGAGETGSACDAILAAARLARDRAFSARRCSNCRP